MHTWIGTEGAPVRVRELAVAGAFEITPDQHVDDRGRFLEWFREDEFSEMAGHRLWLAQANCSVSEAGVVRGIHFADVPPGQAKYVTCVHGAVFDVVVDVRVASPTFGVWDAVTLDTTARRAVYLSEGLGHAFMALHDDSTVVYLCSTRYDPATEHGVHPMDPALHIEWPTTGVDGRPLSPRLSGKDAAAPTLAAAAAVDQLPHMDTVSRFLRQRETGPGTDRA